MRPIQIKLKMILTAAAVLLAILLLFFLQALLMPKYQGRVIEGNFTSEYYEEALPHQLLILGDCEAYENISTMELWRSFGISSYIRGNANQIPSQSYYLLEEALKREPEKPAAVLFSVSALQEREQAKETYNRMVFDRMKWSPVKWKAIRASALPEEHLVEYVFPLLRYHDRWKDLTREDLDCLFRRPVNSFNGYYLRADVRPATEFPSPRRLADPMLPEVSMKYLDSIRELCESAGIPLVLFKAPSLYPVWYPEWDAQVREYAENYGLRYYNCLEEADAAGIDYSQDTYDGGMHMNVYGAEKIALYLGSILQQELALEDLRADPAFSDIYEKKLTAYKNIKSAQEIEFAERGYLAQFGESD